MAVHPHIDDDDKFIPLNFTFGSIKTCLMWENIHSFGCCPVTKNKNEKILFGISLSGHFFLKVFSFFHIFFLIKNDQKF